MQLDQLFLLAFLQKEWVSLIENKGSKVFEVYLKFFLEFIVQVANSCYDNVLVGVLILEQIANFVPLCKSHKLHEGVVNLVNNLACMTYHNDLRPREIGVHSEQWPDSEAPSFPRSILRLRNQMIECQRLLIERQDVGNGDILDLGGTWPLENFLDGFDYVAWDSQCFVLPLAVLHYITAYCLLKGCLGRSF